MRNGRWYPTVDPFVPLTLYSPAMIDLAARRLYNQHLTGRHPAGGAATTVSWLGAVQAQDYPGAKWSLGLRARGLTDRAVQDAFDAGRVLRTHVLRPTWHFLTPADIRWMLELTAPRVNMMSAYQYREHELDARLFAKSHAAFEKALRDGNFLTRLELSSVLQQAGIRVTGQRLAQIAMRAELDGVICSGPRRGSQFTYALLAERAAGAKSLGREEALAELTWRYFSSRGPATLADFTWWSSLSAAEAREGVAMNGARLAARVIDGRYYWSAPSQRVPRRARTIVHLLPTYDEYVIGYKNRDSMMDRSRSARIAVREEYGQLLVVNGRVKGSWKRTLHASGARVEVRPLAPLSSDESEELYVAARRYARFLELPVSVVTSR